MENTDDILKQIKADVRVELAKDATGHDFFHIERVRKLALRIAEKEPDVDLFVIETAALVHDIGDHKFFNGDEEEGHKHLQRFLMKYRIEPSKLNHILQITKELSYKGAGVPTPMSSIEGKIVQDADRLDAIGAIGIARTFAYGGSKNRPIYDPYIKPVCHTSFAAYKTSTAPTINHFYEKLLLLKDQMNTSEAKRIAEGRHQFMADFLSRFYAEWDANDFL